MLEQNTHRQSVVTLALRILVTADAVTFLFAALVHTGMHLGIGPLALAEPRIVPAVIVESVAGLLCAAGAVALYQNSPRAWTLTMLAQVFSLAGVMLGVLSLTLGYGPSTDLNDSYHRVMLGVLVAGIALLLTPAARADLTPLDIGPSETLRRRPERSLP
jgi:hypothetical protein